MLSQIPHWALVLAAIALALYFTSGKSLLGSVKLSRTDNLGLAYMRAKRKETVDLADLDALKALHEQVSAGASPTPAAPE